MDLLTRFNDFIAQHNLFQKKDRLLLAVSGGVDSVVLCELCKQAGYDFVIAHCNFQLRGEESERDDAFVKTLSEKYDVEVLTAIFDTTEIARKERKSIETTARELRYNWFDLLISQPDKQADYILTAHHADDSIETAVMNFFRGTGIAGLHGILPKQGKIIRPLLFARRAEIEQYTKDNNLDFVTDSTNAETVYARNSFRNEILPLIKKNYSEADKNVLATINRMQEAELLYNQAIHLHKKKLLVQKGNEIHIPVLKLLKTEPLSTVLYEIISEFNFTSHQTDEVIALLESDSGKYIQSSTHRIIKNRNWLIITPLANNESQNILIEQGDTKIEFESEVLQVEQIHPADSGTKFKIQNDASLAQLDASQIQFPLLLRKWKQGDYFYPLGMKKKKKLSRFFIDEKLSLPQKENTWVIEMNKKIIWVVGMRIDDRFKITAQTKNILLLHYLPK